MTITWQDEMVPLLRGVFGDIGSTVDYADQQLIDILIFAAHYVSNDLFENRYSVIISTSTITPDPIQPVRDNNFINLTVLRAAAILTNAEWRTSQRKAYTIKDGPSQIDGREIAKQAEALAAKSQGVYDKAVLLYRAGRAVSIAAVMSTANIDMYSTNYTGVGDKYFQ